MVSVLHTDEDASSEVRGGGEGGQPFDPRGPSKHFRETVIPEKTESKETKNIQPMPH